MGILKKLRSGFIKLTRLSYTPQIITICYNTSVNDAKIAEIVKRLKYFTGENTYKIMLLKRSSIPLIFTTPILAVGFTNIDKYKKIYRGYIFDVDYDTNPEEAWEYHELLSFSNPPTNHEHYKQALISYYNSLPKGLNRSYIFGTGSSLEKAINENWADGYRIVCNTIGKDKELWDHINPHVICGGDGIYHFGIGNFAVNFREDLKRRFAETNTIFIYPEIFHVFCEKEFEGFKHRLFPVPNKLHLNIHYNLMVEYSLPRLDNILLLLLLPIACSFSKNVCLWGFDGRAPEDKDFWKNSGRHFYQDDVAQLKELHPAFFNKLIPKGAQDSYVKRVHGDVLEQVLISAENDGYNFVMMHHSYTPTLAKRQAVK